MYALIMAGGGGTRLWPLSRERRPKPFLPLLADGRSLLADTVERLAPLIAAEDVYVVTDARYAEMVQEVLPAVPAANVLGEPVGRNTAPAVTLGAGAIERPDDDVMVVLPADQSVTDAIAFRAALEAAAERAATGDMVTLGVEPTHPATGYGYVIAAGEAVTVAGLASFAVQRFEEKPTEARATELIETGRASWNAGIFVWRRDTLLAGLDAYAGDISRPVATWLTEHRGNEAARPAGWPGSAMKDIYAAVRATSIDYALLEPASTDHRVAVVPMAVGWSDLGSWTALRDHRRAEGEASVVNADASSRIIEVGSRDVFVQASGGRTVAIVGLEGVVVVDTPDAVLISAADAVQDVRKVVQQLRDEGHDELL